ncbi:MAG: hypothetical protein D6820_04410 [Lentisphaerae bacterium]|nr:MAG: hypothetical protein D6820_04410 [Lentisphaerota bacterium]
MRVAEDLRQLVDFHAWIDPATPWQQKGSRQGDWPAFLLRERCGKEDFDFWQAALQREQLLTTLPVEYRGDPAGIFRYVCEHFELRFGRHFQPPSEVLKQRTGNVDSLAYLVAWLETRPVLVWKPGTRQRRLLILDPHSKYLFLCDFLRREIQIIHNPAEFIKSMGRDFKPEDLQLPVAPHEFCCRNWMLQAVLTRYYRYRKELKLCDEPSLKWLQTVERFANAPADIPLSVLSRPRFWIVPWNSPPVGTVRASKRDIREAMP